MNKDNYSKESALPLSSKDKEIITKDVQKLKPSSMLKETEIDKKGIELSKESKDSYIVKEISCSIRDYISSYIVLADSKAGIFIGVITGVLTSAYFHGPKIFETSIKAWSWLEMVAVLGYISLLGSAFSSLLVVWPRTRTTSKKGLISWVNIGTYETASNYLKELFSANDSKILEDMYTLNYDLAVVCRNKYYWLTWGFKLGIFGIIITIFTIIS